MKKYLENLSNIFVIGDVHGCYYTLLNLIKKLPKNSELIFVGDLCDKGNYSKEVLEFAINNNHKCVKGNHEHFFQKHMINAVERNKESLWSSDFKFGGQQSIASYDEDIMLIKKHLNWISELPIFIEIGKYFITHGFALEYYKKRDNKKYHNSFLFNRLYSNTIEPDIDEDIINIFGHCIFDEVQIGNKYFCIDTGCYNDGKLSAIQLGVDKIYQEPMDKRDSTYKLNELKLKDIDLELFNLEQISKITLSENCKYSSFDIVSDEVLEYILGKYPNDGKKEILNMKTKSVILPKQIEKVLSKRKNIIN
jgi:serine/threonine protein phosphatase 1